MANLHDSELSWTTVEDDYSNEELNEIEQLVKENCANYDIEYGCLPLDTSCYMLGIRFKDTPFCKYFEASVLPGTD